MLRTHPETGATALFVNSSFTRRIVGLGPAESDALLAKLLALATTPEYQCRFVWRQGSVAMWDNRVVQHYGSGDFWPHERKMQRVTVVDRVWEKKIPFYRPNPAGATSARL